MQQKRGFSQIEASPMEVAVKQLEINLKRDLLAAGSVNENTDIRLMSLDQSRYYILFISDNSISHTGDNSISFRVMFDGNILKAADSRINNSLADCLLYSYALSEVKGIGTEVINIDNILLEFSDALITFRIYLDVDMPLYLSGYNDYIDEKLEKVRFPMFSEKKFKLYSSLESVVKMTEVVNTSHPNIKVRWK